MEAIVAASITGAASVIAALIQLYCVRLQSRTGVVATVPQPASIEQPARAVPAAVASTGRSLVRPRRGNRQRSDNASMPERAAAPPPNPAVFVRLPDVSRAMPAESADCIEPVFAEACEASARRQAAPPLPAELETSNECVAEARTVHSGKIGPEPPPPMVSAQNDWPHESARAPSYGLDRYWWTIGSMLAVESLVCGIVYQDATPFVNSLCLIPLATFLLAIARPANWAYVAAFVTALHTVALIGYVIGGGHLGDTDGQTIAWLYCGNALLCAAIAFARVQWGTRSATGPLPLS